ncbi:MAG: beta-N-acetylglucosaminidase domain-containing protein, partial [Armatimonadota bacterium]
MPPRVFSTAFLLLILALSAAAAVAEPLSLTPAPQSVKTVAGACQLPALTYSLSGQTSPPVDYALELLAKTLGATARQVPPTQAAIHLVVASSATELATAATKASLKPAPSDRTRDSYVLDCGFSNPSRIVLTAGPVGLIYGVHAVAQMAAKDGLRGSPRLAISDWPSFLTRAWTGVPRNPADPATGKLLDWFARWRINTCYYEIYGDAGQDSVPPEVAQLQRECARRGITLYGQISNWRTELLLKRELCACNPDDIAHLRRYATELLDRGCDGLIFLFDDITQTAVEHPLACPLCKQRFKGLAEAQVELMRPMLEVARERGVTRLIVCPTPYYVGWEDTQLHKLPGKAYFAAWASAEVMKGVQVYHCLLREKDLAAVQQAGLRNFIYWYNGNRDYEACLPNAQRVRGLWGGFTELAFGWYGYRWDTARGVVPLADTYDAFRRLPALTQDAWLCSGGDYPFALWGAYCWNAEEFNPAQTERGILQACYGPAAPAEYARWRDIVRKWYPRLLSPPAGLSASAQAAFLKELAADAETAKQAALTFKAKQQFSGGEDIAPTISIDDFAKI